MKRRNILLLLSFFIASCFPGFLSAQTIEEQMTKSHPNCRTIFSNAMDILPAFYKERSFDSLNKAVEVWERSCSDLPEVTITRILLNIEESKFNVSDDINVVSVNALNDYARSFPSESKMQGFQDATDLLFYKFSVGWSTLLLKNKKLDNNEQFICRILSGDIKNPEKEIQQNAATYPELAALFEKDFEIKRKQVRGEVALGTGIWIPTNNLATLGVHPSFTFQVGARDMRNQIDFTMQLRYLYSANPYAVNRHEHPDSTDYYLGYYVGLDYAYYFISKKRFEMGIAAGIGYDAFDFAPQPYDYYYYYPYSTSHYEIGSFNGNAGLRFNYYFSNSFYMGLLGRYNGIHYSTHGGTNLSGDAITIDLIFGLNGGSNSPAY